MKFLFVLSLIFSYKMHVIYADEQLNIHVRKSFHCLLFDHSCFNLLLLCGIYDRIFHEMERFWMSFLAANQVVDYA